MAYLVVDYIVTAHTAMAYIVMAHIVIDDLHACLNFGQQIKKTPKTHFCKTRFFVLCVAA